MSNGDQLSSPSFSIYSVTISVSVFSVFPFRMEKHVYYYLCVSTHETAFKHHYGTCTVYSSVLCSSNTIGDKSIKKIPIVDSC